MRSDRPRDLEARLIANLRTLTLAQRRALCDAAAVLAKKAAYRSHNVIPLRRKADT